MAASDALNDQQFGYFAKPKNVESIARPAAPKYAGLAEAANKAAEAENMKTLKPRRRSA